MDAVNGTLSAAAEETSQVFVGRWLLLVSTTNWEKGRIIAEWRAALIESGAATTEYSDEAWSRRLANVSPQHTGRLRRAFVRFGEVYSSYEGLYWSHFQAALDWDDAEMWLEGAVQNDWSVSDMRRERAATLGTSAADDSAAANEPFDDDADAEATGGVPRTIASSEGVIAEADEEGFADESDGAETVDHEALETDSTSFDELDGQAAPAVRPFAELPELPSDLADAFESFKLAILRHKLAGWTEVARDDVIGALTALEQLALAPS